MLFLKEHSAAAAKQTSSTKKQFWNRTPELMLFTGNTGPRTAGMRLFQKRASLLGDADMKSTTVTPCHVTKSCLTEKG